MNLPATDKIGYVFEVKAYNPKERTITDVQSLGWAYVPLYVTVENENKSYSLFSNAGLLQVPLYKGEVAKRHLLQALNADDPMIALQRDTNLNLLQPTSLLIRVHSNQVRVRHKNTDYSDTLTAYLPPQNQAKYLYNVAQQVQSKEKPVFSISQEEHLRRVQDSFKLAYGFKFPRITQ